MEYGPSTVFHFRTLILSAFVFIQTGFHDALHWKIRQTFWWNINIKTLNSFYYSRGETYAENMRNLGKLLRISLSLVPEAKVGGKKKPKTLSMTVNNPGFSQSLKLQSSHCICIASADKVCWPHATLFNYFFKLRQTANLQKSKSLRPTPNSSPLTLRRGIPVP